MADVVFDELLGAATRCGHVILAGYGEPLSHPGCVDMLRALAANGVDIAMATNGLLVTADVARQLAAVTTLSLINVSIDSPDPAVYQHVRGGSVRRALRGVEHLVAAVDDPMRIMVSAVAMAPTLRTLARFPALLASIGVRRLSVQAVMDYNDYASSNGLLGRADLAPVLDEVRAACERHGISLELSVADRSAADVHDETWARERYYGVGSWDESRTRMCTVPWELPFIDKDGRVFPCCFAASADELQLGQLVNASFEGIWHGEPARRFRRDIVDGRTTPEICRRCTVAPLGTHPYKEWAAVIVAVDVMPATPAIAVVTVSARNTGEREWNRADHVRVGTSAPRDHNSGLATRRWLLPNRPATFREDAVPPGAIATFTFPVRRPVRGPVRDSFELVADGACWVPGTAFTVAVATPGTLVATAANVAVRPLHRLSRQ